MDVYARRGQWQATMHDEGEGVFARAFRDHWHRLVRNAHAALGSRDEAEDAVSSAFTRALDHRAAYDPARASLPA